MVNCFAFAHFIGTSIVIPLTDAGPAELQSTFVALTCPAPADVVGVVHPAGIVTATCAPVLFWDVPAVKVIVNVVVEDGVTDEGEIAIVPCPSPGAAASAGAAVAKVSAATTAKSANAVADLRTIGAATMRPPA
jgi:hypothetical protein